MIPPHTKTEPRPRPEPQPDGDNFFTLKEGVRRGVAAPRSCTPPLDSPYRQKSRSHAERRLERDF